MPASGGYLATLSVKWGSLESSTTSTVVATSIVSQWGLIERIVNWADHMVLTLDMYFVFQSVCSAGVHWNSSGRNPAETCVGSPAVKLKPTFSVIVIVPAPMSHSASKRPTSEEGAKSSS